MDPALAMISPPLLQHYNEDVIRWTIKTFHEKAVSLKQLNKWKKKYPIIYPWDTEYNIERTGYNRIIQVYPLAIIMAKTEKDIKWALKKAQELKIPFSLKNGGHDHTGASLSDGFIINVSGINEIHIDPNYEFVEIGCGVLLGQLDLELANKGCAWVPHGTCANVSALGLSLSAGIGALTRKYGLTIDHLQEATIILANGSTIKANKDENDDLFWFLRGCGASNIGIVSSLKLNIYNSLDVVLFELEYKLEQLQEILEIWDKFGPYAENNLASKILFFPQSNIDITNHVHLKGQYEGSLPQLQSLLNDFIVIAQSVHIWKSSPIDAAIFYNQGSSEPPWYFFYETIFTVEQLQPETINALVDFSKTAPSECSIVMNALGGKMAEIKSDETAFPWRDSKLWIHIMSESRDQRKFDLMRKTTKSIYYKLLDSGLRNPETGVGRLYCNFKDLELTQNEYPLAYWGKNYERIKEIKKKYDPDNIFKPLQGIHP
jgi:hypothetical protein